MGTIIRPEISQKSKYWISKHRYYELKHFCLQYDEWVKALLYLKQLDGKSQNNMQEIKTKNTYDDPTKKLALRRLYFEEKIRLVEQTAIKTDGDLYSYILKAVTKGYSFNYLKTNMNIPCGKDMYYDRYRKFFYLLSKEL